MLTRDVASITAPFEAIASQRAQGKRNRRIAQGQAKPLAIELDLCGDVDVVFSACRDEPISVGTQ